MLRRSLNRNARSFSTKYDLIIIGSGPAASSCAIDSAKKGKKVAIVDRQKDLGGVCVHTGTIPSKTFREAAIHLTGYRHQGFYGKSYSFSSKTTTILDILKRVSIVVKSEVDAIRSRLIGKGVDLISGHARFESNSTITVTTNGSKEVGKKVLELEASKYLIACGTRPARRKDIPCDGKKIMDSDQILSGTLDRVPRNLIVVGAGVIGMEYASMINVLPGTTVTVIDGRPEILQYADKDVLSSLQYEMRLRGARFLLGETLESVKTHEHGVSLKLASGKTVHGDAMLYAVGRLANTFDLNLKAAGLTQNKRGLITVNHSYQTEQNHIYAAGDCIGAPSLASTSLEQGRLASCHMWEDPSDIEMEKSQLESGNYPYGIYTIPEISMVGKTEDQLTQELRNYGVGIARYSELAKGQMLGGQTGFLKILFDQDTLEVLGVHAIGEGATEIIHIGQVAIAMGCTLDYFRDVVFNYPTLAEAYRVAALNGLGQISHERLENTL